MPTRSAAVLASGTTNAAKLFIAALAFTSAYVGFSAYSSAGSAAVPAGPVTTVTLAAREVPVTEDITTAAVAGKVTVNVLADGQAGCVKSYVARSLLINPDPDQGLTYRWRLTRWSPATKTWRTYLSDHDGTAAAEQTVQWRPRVTGNPGWYRVELKVQGADPINSDRFQVTC
ncbi:hypothetical protein [Nonomuraea fuscirosea]|uniref:hypothetical protein n=1 Tax=Nonomuraea fuscirosea TaxID=1291556 RepID=UPI0033E40171